MVESVNNLQVDLRYLETFITHDPNTENRLYFIQWQLLSQQLLW